MFKFTYIQIFKSGDGELTEDEYQKISLQILCSSFQVIPINSVQECAPFGPSTFLTQKICQLKHRRVFLVCCKFKSFSNIIVVIMNEIYPPFFAVSSQFFIILTKCGGVEVFDVQFAIYLPTLEIQLITLRLSMTKQS